MPLTLIDRTHLRRLLELAKSTPGMEDIVSAYTLADGAAPPSDAAYEPLRDPDGEVVTDEAIMHLHWGETRIQFFPSSGNWKTAKPYEPIRLNNWVLQCRFDGKWYNAMHVSSVTVPELRYDTDDIVVLKIKSHVYANGPSWVEVGTEPPSLHL